MSCAAEYRTRSDALLREATRTENLNERSRLINQAIHYNELAAEAERAAGGQRRSDTTVIPFEDSAEAWDQAARGSDAG